MMKLFNRPRYFFVLMMAFIVALAGCFSKPMTRPPGNGLPQSLEREGLNLLMAHALVFEEARGRFELRIKRPGIDASYQGVFLVRRNGYLRVEVYTPFGTVAYYLELIGYHYTFAGEDRLVEGDSFSVVDPLQEEWGLEFAPYQIAALFSGGFVDPFYYRILPEVTREKGNWNSIALRSDRGHREEEVRYDRRTGIVLRRKLIPLNEPQPIYIAYTYKCKDDSESAVATNDTVDCGCLLPIRTEVSQKKRHAKLILDLSVATCRLNPSAPGESNHEGGSPVE
jgi:hypothetical protein